jgi:hypothetical protein
MAEFEAACDAKNLKLYELPPRIPQFNGGGERYNGAWRYEVYACTDLPGSVEELNPQIGDWHAPCNFVRPHGARADPLPHLDHPHQFRYHRAHETDRSTCRRTTSRRFLLRDPTLRVT